MGIRCRQKRKFKATTNSNHEFPVSEKTVAGCLEKLCENKSVVFAEPALP
jgi:hypothetical protein